MKDPVHRVMVALASRGRLGSPAYFLAEQLLAEAGGDTRKAERAALALAVLPPVPITPPKSRPPSAEEIRGKGYTSNKLGV